MNKRSACFIWVIIVFFFSPVVFGQCATDANLQITASVCQENGAVVINAVPAGIYTYEITTGPEWTLAATSNSFSGLAAGNYIISILSNGCPTLNKQLVVPGNYGQPGLLTATTTSISCPGNTGSLVANQPSGGCVPYTYSIVGGPVMRSTQNSAAFYDLPDGTYAVQAKDSCGIVRTSQFTVGVDTGNFYAYVFNWEILFVNCNDLLVPVYQGYDHTVSHSLLKVWYVSPSGDTLKANNFNAKPVEYDTLLNRARDYGTWQILVFDECNRMRVSTFYHAQRTNAMYIEGFAPACGGGTVVIGKEWRYGIGVGFIVKSCTTGEIVFSEYQPANSNWSSSGFVMAYDSCYNLEQYNECGDRIYYTTTAPSRPPLEITACGYPSCMDVQRGDIWLNDANNSSLRPATFTVIAGPAAELGKATQMVSRYDNWASLSGLMAGTYQIGIADACGRKDTLRDVVVTGGFIQTFKVTQTPNCSGGANLHVKITSNHGSACNNDWYLTFVDHTTPYYEPVNISTTNTLSVNQPGSWEADYFNVTAASVTFFNANYYNCGFDTTIAIHQYRVPSLANINGYVCSGTGVGSINYNVNNGAPPFRFRIRDATTAMWSSWQDSSLFTGIGPGNYEVNVEDACPNSNTRSVSFVTWTKSDVIFSTPCALIGGPLTLSADPPVAFVEYEWLFNDSVVGSGATYTIQNYDPSMQGLYKLRQVFRGGLCSDSTSKWLVACSVLPLTFSEFTGQLVQDKTELNWRTLIDVDGLQFMVERSADGVSFSTIGVVLNAKNPDGSVYWFVDANPLENNFYRIGYFTNPGSISYSNVVRIKKQAAPSRNSLVQVRPVPFKTKFLVQINSQQRQQYVIRLFDVSGKKMVQRAVTVAAGENIFWFDEEVRSLTAGYYFIEVSGDNFLQREKILKQ